MGVKNDSTRAEHSRDHGMTQRMHREPNIGMRVYDKEKEALALLWLCVGEVMANEITSLTKTSRFLGGGGLSPP